MNISSHVEKTKELSSLFGRSTKQCQVFYHASAYFYEHIHHFVSTLRKEYEKNDKVITDEDLNHLINIEKIIEESLHVIQKVSEKWFETIIVEHGEDILYYPNIISKWRNLFSNELCFFEAKYGDVFQMNFNEEQDDINISSDFNQMLKTLQEFKSDNEILMKKKEDTIQVILKNRYYISKTKKEEIDKKLENVKNINIRDEDLAIHKNEILGTGGFGTVYKGTLLKTSEIVAVKEIRSDRISVNSILSFCIEVLTMNKARFNFVVELVGAHLSYPHRIITRYCSGRSLFERIHKTKQNPNFKPLTSSQLTKIAYQIALGMTSLHEKKIVHRDLKTLNILLDEYDNAYVADFGLSGKTEGNDMIADVGTPNYTAPEILTRNHYGSKVDVYSYAIVLWEMLMKTVPFADLTKEQIYDHIVTHNWRLLLQPESPKGLKNLITRCWSKNPKDRPTFKEIVSIFNSGQIYFPNSEPLNFNEIRNEYHCPPINEKYLEKVLRNPKDKNFSSIVNFIYKNMDEILKKKICKFDVMNSLAKSEENISSILLLASQILSTTEEFNLFLKNDGEKMFKVALESDLIENKTAALIFAAAMPQALLTEKNKSYLSSTINLLGKNDPTPNKFILVFISSFDDSIFDKTKSDYFIQISDALIRVDGNDIEDEKTFESISRIITSCYDYLCSDKYKRKFKKEDLRVFVDFIKPNYKIETKFADCIIKIVQNDQEIQPKLIQNLLQSIIINENLDSIFCRLLIYVENNMPTVFDVLINDSDFLSILSTCLKSSQNVSAELFLFFCLVKRCEYNPNKIEQHEILQTLLDMKDYNAPRLQILAALVSSDKFCENKEIMKNINHLLASSLSGDQNMINAAIRTILSMSKHKVGCEFLGNNDILEVFVGLFTSSSNIVETKSAYTILKNVIQYEVKIPQISLVASCLLHSLLYEYSLKETILDTLVAIVKIDPKCVQVDDLKLYILKITRQDTPIIVLQSFRLLAAVDQETFKKTEIYKDILSTINQVLREPNFHYPKIIKAALMIIKTLSEYHQKEIIEFIKQVGLFDYVNNVLENLPVQDKRADYMRNFVIEFQKIC